MEHENQNLNNSANSDLGTVRRSIAQVLLDDYLKK